MEFPKIYDKCPICGAKERVIDEIVKEEKAKGKIAKEREPASSQRLLAIMDPAVPAIAFPAVRVYYDYCVKCGFEYPWKMVMEKMTLDQYQDAIRQQLGFTQGSPRGRGS